MRLVDVLQWVALALISTGFFLISLRAGLICAGILLIVGTTTHELQQAMRAQREQAQQQRRQS